MAWSAEKISYALMAAGWGLFFLTIAIVSFLGANLYWLVIVSWVIGSTGVMTFGYCLIKRLFKRLSGKH